MRDGDIIIGLLIYMLIGVIIFVKFYNLGCMVMEYVLIIGCLFFVNLMINYLIIVV